MAFPAEIARQFTEDKIAFVKRMNLKAEVLEPGFVRLRVPLAGNENHIGSMYAGALFTLAEIPGGALFLTSFDASQFYPIVKEMNLRFRRHRMLQVSSIWDTRWTRPCKTFLLATSA